MVPPPIPLSSPELGFSPSASDSIAGSPARVPQVPDPRAAGTPRNGPPSPFTQAGHQRAHSDTADSLRPRTSIGLGFQSFTEMSGSPAPSPQPYHFTTYRPASPLAVGASQHPVGGSHSRTHAFPQGNHPNHNHHMSSVLGHYGSASASSTPALATFPHHPPGPHSPPYEHAGPSSYRRHTPGQIARSHVAHRTRAASGGHERHLRCSPDCTAADAPYHLLSTVIGRASTHNFRMTVDRPVKRKAPQDEDIEMQVDVEATARPNIQTRRRRTRTLFYPGPSSPTLPAPAFSTELRPLAFDRKWLESTPPLFPVDKMRDPPPGGDFFTEYQKQQQPAYNATSNAVLIQGTEPEFALDIPKSSSAPAVPLLSTRDRGLSDASVTSVISADVLQSQTRHGVSNDQNIGSTYVTSPRRLPPNRNEDQSGGPNRFANFSGKRLDPGARLHSIGQLVGDPSELSSYLGEDLAAALKQRLTPEASASDRLTKRKADVITEAEWSFDVPLSKALGEAVKGLIKALPNKENYHLVEYGCNKETPNTVLTDVIRTLCIRSVGPGRPKKVVNVTHQCDSDFDIRLLQANLASDSASYRKIKLIPSPMVLTSFSYAGFTESALPPSSVDLALCAGELSKLHGSLPPKPFYMFTSQAEEREQRAEKDLTGWLKTRAKELKPGGILACTFAIRTSPVPDHPERQVSHHGAAPAHPPQASSQNYSASLPTSPRTLLDDNHNHITTPMTEINPSPFVTGPPLPSPPMTNGRTRRYRPDIWQAIPHALSPAIQRLVSLGEIKTQVAPLLVDVPFWPRTLESVQSALSQSADWETLIDPSLSSSSTSQSSEQMRRTASAESEVMLEEYAGDAFSREEREEWSQAGVKIVRLSHPAWKAFREGKIDRAAYARRIAMFCRSVYEGHLKKILREKGRMDISQCETTVQELFKVLVEKCELGALDALEIDVGIVVLKRTG